MNIEQQQQKNASFPKYFSLPHSLTFSDLPLSPVCLPASLREFCVLKSGTHSVVFITNIYHFWNTLPLAYWLWIIASYYGEIILE